MAYLFLRTALNFLLGFGGNGLKSLLTVTDYLSFVTHLLIVFGASFLFPLLIILLNLAGVVSAARLAKFRRIEIFLVFAFAGFVTPSGDPFTMPALALTLCLFYEAAVLIAKWNDRRRAAAAAMSELSGLADTEASPAPVAWPIEPPDAVEPPRDPVSAGRHNDNVT
jgi:sec-independent protein translocase protein TatC